MELVAFGAIGGLALFTYGISFIPLVAIEAYYFWRLTRTGWWRSVLICLITNVVSTLFGFMAALFTLVSAAIVIMVAWATQWKRTPAWVTVLFLVVTFGIPFVGLLSILIYDWTASISNENVMFLFLLGPSYGTSFLIEGWIAKCFVDQEDPWRAVVEGNAVSYLILYPLWWALAMGALS
jgi:hypothetical protein